MKFQKSFKGFNSKEIRAAKQTCAKSPFLFAPTEIQRQIMEPLSEFVKWEFVNIHTLFYLAVNLKESCWSFTYNNDPYFIVDDKLYGRLGNNKVDLNNPIDTDKLIKRFTTLKNFK